MLRIIIFDVDYFIFILHDTSHICQFSSSFKTFWMVRMWLVDGTRLCVKYAATFYVSLPWKINKMRKSWCFIGKLFHCLFLVFVELSFCSLGMFGSTFGAVEMIFLEMNLRSHSLWIGLNFRQNIWTFSYLSGPFRKFEHIYQFIIEFDRSIRLFSI